MKRKKNNKSDVDAGVNGRPTKRPKIENSPSPTEPPWLEDLISEHEQLTAAYCHTQNHYIRLDNNRSSRQHLENRINTALQEISQETPLLSQEEKKIFGALLCRYTKCRFDQVVATSHRINNLYDRYQGCLNDDNKNAEYKRLIQEKLSIIKTQSAWLKDHLDFVDASCRGNANDEATLNTIRPTLDNVAKKIQQIEEKIMHPEIEHRLSKLESILTEYQTTVDEYTQLSPLIYIAGVPLPTDNSDLIPALDRLENEADALIKDIPAQYRLSSELKYRLSELCFRYAKAVESRTNGEYNRRVHPLFALYLEQNHQGAASKKITRLLLVMYKQLKAKYEKLTAALPLLYNINPASTDLAAEVRDYDLLLQNELTVLNDNIKNLGQVVTQSQLFPPLSHSEQPSNSPSHPQHTV